MCAHEHKYWQNPSEGIRSPGAKITGSCELSDVGAGNLIWVLCKSTLQLPPPAIKVFKSSNQKTFLTTLTNNQHRPTHPIGVSPSHYKLPFVFISSLTRSSSLSLQGKYPSLALAPSFLFLSPNLSLLKIVGAGICYKLSNEHKMGFSSY